MSRTSTSKDWGAESAAIGDYSAAIRSAQESSDSGTRELLESILADEETHIDWIEGRSEQITQMGLDTYLGKQVG